MPEPSLIASALGVVDKSIQAVKRLREIDLKMQAAEYKDLLADLLSDMADLKVQLVELKEENLKLQKLVSGKDEKTEIRRAFERVRNVYRLKEKVFDFKAGDYCPHCFEANGDMMVLVPFGVSQKCNKCKGMFS
jgi:hypothetical protein